MKTQIIIKRLRYIFLLPILVSCSNKPPEILKIEGSEYTLLTEEFVGWEERTQSYVNEPGGLSKTECFIVVNHPKKKPELLKLINEFNANTMNKDSIIKYSRGYLRVFYKGTNGTMEAYRRDRDDAFYNIDSYYMDKWHRNDKLMGISWGMNHEEQTFRIAYSVYGDIEYIFNASDDELFNLK